MKKSLILLLALSGFHFLIGQPCPIGLSGLFINDPQNLFEYECTNERIAKYYAPVFNQFVDPNSEHGAGGLADYPLKVNFDDDWIHSNNWTSLENLEEEDIEDDIAVYYTVLWTEHMWIITYSFYFPRNWSLCPFNIDEHLGDLPRALVVVNRVPRTILMVSIKAHGCAEQRYCGGLNVCEQNPSVFGRGLVYNGIHPYIYSSTGSHAFYFSAAEGFADANLGSSLGCITLDFDVSCAPVPPFGGNFLPGATPSAIGDANNICDDIGIGATANSAIYQLIDVFEPNSLWEKRTDGNVFIQGASINAQNFIKGAPSPWNGDFGANPLQFVHNNLEGTACVSSQFSGYLDDCQYEYNPYLCDEYKIVMHGNMTYNGQSRDNPRQNGNTLRVKFKFNALNDIPITPPEPNKIKWSWILPADFDPTNLSCEGCGGGSGSWGGENEVVFTLNDTYLSELNMHEFKVFAEADLVECGNIKSEFSINIEFDAMISNINLCNTISFEVPDDLHLDGNNYEWNFFEYQDKATITNNGRNVDFNTEELQQEIIDNETPSELSCHLKITNPSIETLDTELTGKVEIPFCDSIPPPQSMIIFPNPTSDQLHLEMEGFEFDKDVELTIIDHQFNPIKTEMIGQRQQTIDVSDLRGGLYYIYTITDEGQIISKKFCVNGH